MKKPRKPEKPDKSIIRTHRVSIYDFTNLAEMIAHFTHVDADKVLIDCDYDTAYFVWDTEMSNATFEKEQEKYEKELAKYQAELVKYYEHQYAKAMENT